MNKETRNSQVEEKRIDTKRAGPEWNPPKIIIAISYRLFSVFFWCCSRQPFKHRYEVIVIVKTTLF